MYAVRTSAIISNVETNDILHSVQEKRDYKYFVRLRKGKAKTQNATTSAKLLVVFLLVLITYLPNPVLVTTHAS
jgi:hypothetical protein